MASVTVKLTDKSVRKDVRGRTFINEADKDTNQYITFYPRKDMPTLFDGLKKGQVVVLSGTLHNIGDNPKVIVTSVS